MIIAPGTTSQSIDVQIVDDSGTPVTGLVAATFPSVYYSLAGPNAAVQITPLSDLALITTAFTANGVKERTGGAGMYRLDVPNAAFASAGEVTIYGETSGKHLFVPGGNTIDVVYTKVDVRKYKGLDTYDTDSFTNQIFTSIGDFVWNATTAAHAAAGSFGLMLGKLGAPVGATIAADIAAVFAATGNISNNTWISHSIPAWIELKDSGSATIQIVVTFNDETGTPKDLDSGNPTVILVNDAGTDLSSRLSAWSHPATGKYTIIYTSTAGDAIEGLHWEITGTVNTKLRRTVAYTQLADTTAVDFTNTDRTALNSVLAKVGVLPSVTMLFDAYGRQIVDAHKMHFDIQGGNTLRAFAPDNTTVIYTKTLTTDPSAQPIIGN